MNKRIKATVIISAIVMLVAAMALCACAASPAQSNQSASASQSASAEQSAKAESLTTYWSADSSVAQQLREYVAKVTDPNDKDNFVPVEDRIAVFDMDGTLTCETYYTYFDTMMFIEYCLHDHPEKVSDELKQVA